MNAPPPNFIAPGYVRVVNARRDMAPDSQPEEGETVVPVDRTNPVLGNRHILRNKLDLRERDRVCDAYDRDLEADFALRGPMYQAIWDIASRVLMGERICLLCHCRPSRCHADSIERKVRELVASTRQQARDAPVNSQLLEVPT